jgi:hypothetical protein
LGIDSKDKENKQRMITDIFDLYSDFLITNLGQHTSTSLSAVLDKCVSHDQITRALSKPAYGSVQLWQYVKPMVSAMKSLGESGVLCLDDTIEAKPYTKASSLNCWHFDHTKGRSVKGINQLTALFHCKGTSMPVGYELIEKTIWYCDVATRKEKRISLIDKHELYRKLIEQAVINQVPIRYVLSDKWFSSVENMRFIHHLGLHFVFPMKSNRLVALSESDKKAGKYQPIDSVVIEENQTLTLYLEQFEHCLKFSKQVFKNGDEQKGVLYLLTNDLGADASLMQAQYALRWKVEEFYKSIKSNIGYANAPVHTHNTIKNHLFLANIAFVKLEQASLKLRKNHFALKAKLTANANKHTWQFWKDIRQRYKFDIYDFNVAA